MTETQQPSMPKPAAIAEAAPPPPSSPPASSPPLRVQRLSETAVLPRRASAHAAGYDLCAAHDAVIPPRARALVKTDLAVSLPPNTYARVAPRSSLALRHGVDVGAGVVDRDYRGNVGVVMFNFGEEEFVVSAGARIAQMVLERIETPEVEEVRELDDTARGAGGYGSTGR